MHRYIPISIPDDFYVGGRDSVYATIDSDLIDSTLSNFPVGIEIGDIPFMADRSATDWQNLHCTVGGTECYVEVDVWDVTTPQAILHVKVASVSSSADTVIDIRFGTDNTTTYVGQTGDTAAQNVWDSNFVAVYHMSQDPSGGSGAILDSTSNGYNGTSAGTMTSGDLIDFGFGKSLEFDGSNDYINCGDVCDIVSDATIEMFAAVIGTSGDPYILSKYVGGVTDAGYFLTKRFGIRSGTGSLQESGNATTDLVDESIHYWVCVRNSDRLSIYVDNNGEENYSTGNSTNSAANPENLYIGAHTAGGPPAYFTHNKISEVRISNTARSAAWIKATNAVLAKTLVTLS